MVNTDRHASLTLAAVVVTASPGGPVVPRVCRTAEHAVLAARAVAAPDHAGGTLREEGKVKAEKGNKYRSIRA